MLIFKRGDTFRFVMDVYDEVTDAPANLIGATATSKLRTKNTQEVIATLTATIPAAPAGVVDLFKAAADTVSWTIGEAVLDVRITLASGDIVTTSTASLAIAAAESA